ncbi:uncharacterized protein LOC119669965 isoform X2 [Teleopsis dalmanni]|uniref:uncharacterized protein LOC119669965 isoform X2 n=1 Tax=Teleopsis dalmanni TaxID=139649 RepID=UPI0018CEE139|nr:uncharacterized protein LOC119669965 isoform X2 [Teleopsis dalmanni]
MSRRIFRLPSKKSSKAERAERDDSSMGDGSHVQSAACLGGSMDDIFCDAIFGSPNVSNKESPRQPSPKKNQKSESIERGIGDEARRKSSPKKNQKSESVERGSGDEARRKSVKKTKKSIKNLPKLVSENIVNMVNESEISKLTEFLNSVFERRLRDLDNPVTNLNKQLKLEVYRDWIAMLSKLNKSIFINMESLENDAVELLMKQQDLFKIKTAEDNEMEKKYRSDICKLIKIYRVAYGTGQWNFDVEFNTIRKEEILGGKYRNNY